MNTRNEWKNLLKIYNEDLAPKGIKIVVEFNENSFYSVNIVHGGKTYDYASNHFESELDGAIIGAAHDAEEIVFGKLVYVLTYVGLSDNDPDANGYFATHLFYKKEDAKKKLALLRENELENIKNMGYKPCIYYDTAEHFHVTWAGDAEGVTMVIEEERIK